MLLKKMVYHHLDMLLNCEEHMRNIQKMLASSFTTAVCKEKLRKPLPPQYALELLTVYAWEQGSGDTEFNTAQGFRTVLELVTKYRELRMYWTMYYDFQDQDISKYLHRQLTRAR
ncbi:2'-5'-oligoadenylate synthase 1A [Microtus ochrogaster]|uniref:2'-5'-oligoadenylate synthase 1A n=1 Tax=Microtus ochrogaster TaxID=79684 RepID=A0A8J6G0V6_MICOH|nr:2'-5'-oligoadenylate synthase 1A [Microtus ochrogaster]